MLQSKLFTKTRKDFPKNEVSKNAQLLIQAGYINKEMAGVYDFLPLGLRTFNKITQIIREEMNAIGGQEIQLTALQNAEPWQKSGRWPDEDYDVWFKTNLHNGENFHEGKQLGLASTHEEPLTELMKQHINSYKDLPAYPYQFQVKFRNELRSKSGIMRGREFSMKDLYSFSISVEELDIFYEEVKVAYEKVFDRLGMSDHTFLTFASGGTFSKFSHEYQTVCDAGEDTIYLSREKNLAVNHEVYTDEVLSDLGLKKDELEEVKAAEVANIFKLVTKYSGALGLNFVDESGESKPVIMGSYGIGTTRVMGTIVELFHDDKGIIWPESVAPYQVHLVGLNLDDSQSKEKAVEVYNKLLEAGVEVLFDDRIDKSPGAKFAESDLIGIPYRIVVSKKTGDELEVKRRDQENAEYFELQKIISML